MRAQITILIATIVLLAPAMAHACDGCGCRGGPGYRGPNGKCVGWAQIGKVCGSPPTERCTAEGPAVGADRAASDGQDIEKQRPKVGNGQ